MSTSADIQHTLKQEILDTLKYCINCRFCLPSCPRFNITSGEVSQGASGISRSLYYAVKWDESDKNILNELRDILFSCTTCKSCENACKSLSTGTKLMDSIVKGRELLIEMQIGPMPEQKKVLESLYNHGNPYSVTARKRKAVVKELGLPEFTADSEVLLYLGCSSTVEEDVQKTAIAMSRILTKANVKFGVLEDESCCGDPALKIGDSALFEEMSKKNIEIFKKHNVKNIVTLSPHCYDTFDKKYPEELMQGIKMQHYTQYLGELIEQKKIVFSGSVAKKIMYHDPCYLSKYNSIIAGPRGVLSSIPEAEMVEFAEKGLDSLCCGGGGGRMWADFESETDRLANIRVGEAVEKGAQILVTACPWCFTNMKDGAKVMNAEDKLEVLGLAEVCAEAL